MGLTLEAKTRSDSAAVSAGRASVKRQLSPGGRLCLVHPFSPLPYCLPSQLPSSILVA